MNAHEFSARYNELAIAEEAAWQERSSAFSESVKFPSTESVDRFVAASLKWLETRQAMTDFILPRLVFSTTDTNRAEQIPSVEIQQPS